MQTYRVSWKWTDRAWSSCMTSSRKPKPPFSTEWVQLGLLTSQALICSLTYPVSIITKELAIRGRTHWARAIRVIKGWAITTERRSRRVDSNINWKKLSWSLWNCRISGKSATQTVRLEWTMWRQRIRTQQWTAPSWSFLQTGFKGLIQQAGDNHFPNCFLWRKDSKRILCSFHIKKQKAKSSLIINQEDTLQLKRDSVNSWGRNC